MNVYILSPEANDAVLVARRLMDQDVHSLPVENAFVFSVSYYACQIDRRSGTWKSTNVPSQRMEAITTDALPYLQNDSDADGDGGNGNSRLISSRWSSDSSLAGLARESLVLGSTRTMCASNSQEKIISDESERFGLDIFIIPWQTRISDTLHRLFLAPTGIHILAVNTASFQLTPYIESFLQMMASLRANTGETDLGSIHVLLADTTTNKDTDISICKVIRKIVDDWCKDCQLHGETFLISKYLQNDQSKCLKSVLIDTICRLTNEDTPVFEPMKLKHCDNLITNIQRLRNEGHEIIQKELLDSDKTRSNVNEDDLFHLHLRKKIFYMYRMSPKLIVIDANVLITAFYKIVLHTDNSNKVMELFEKSDLGNIIDIKDVDILIDLMLYLGLLAAARHNSNKLLLVTSRVEIPGTLTDIRNFPSQEVTPHTHTPVICLKFKNSTLTVGAFESIICGLLNYYPYDTQGGKALLFRNFAAFKISSDGQERERLSLFSDGCDLFVHIVRYTRQQNYTDPKKCVLIRKQIEEAIMNGFNAGLKCANLDEEQTFTKEPGRGIMDEGRKLDFTFCLRCPALDNHVINSEGFIDVSEVVRLSSKADATPKFYECNSHSDRAHPHFVDITQIMQPWFCDVLKTDFDTEKESSEKASACPAEPTKINSRMLGRIARCIGSGWQMLALELDIDKPTLDKIEENNLKNTEKAIADVIDQWVKNCHGKATLQDLQLHLKAVNITVNWEEFHKLFINK